MSVWSWSTEYGCVAILQQVSDMNIVTTIPPDYAIVIKVEGEGVNAGDQNIESQIKLVTLSAPLDQKWVVDVLLHLIPKTVNSVCHSHYRVI